MASTVRKAVFPGAGMGTRFLPATKSVPKEMLPIVDRPLIQYAVDEARAAGIEELVIVTGRGGRAIEDYFDHPFELAERLAAGGRREEIAAIEQGLPASGQIAYTRQQAPLGLGHAVWCARHLVGEGAFAVLLADDLIVAEVGCIAQMMAAHAEVGGIVMAVMDVAPEETARYGIVAPGAEKGRIIEVRGLVEKPDPGTAPSTLAVIGRYILVPQVFDHLGRGTPGAGGEIQLTDALASMIGALPVHAFRFAGRRYDCGDKAGWVEATVALALAREDLRERTAAAVRAALASHGLDSQ